VILSRSRQRLIPTLSDTIEEPMASPIYGSKDAAAYCGFTKARLLQLVRAGRVQATRTSSGYIFEEAELARLVASLRPYRRKDDHGGHSVT
jgi:hypothetical protein